MAILQVNVRPAIALNRVAGSRSEDSQHRKQPTSDQFVISQTQAADQSTADQSTEQTHVLQSITIPAQTNPLSTSSSPNPSLWQKIVWRLMPSTTIGRALISARERLDEAGCSTASLDAQVILAHVLGVDRSWLFAHHEYTLSAEQANAYTKLIARRMSHEPVAYLIGRKEFYGLDFQIDRRVLIPRPETELLVDAVLDYVNSHDQEEPLIADVGTGSGAIALAIASNAPHVTLYAIDLSQEALAVAYKNVARLDARHQVHLLNGDLLTPLPGQVDVLVANLPYISTDTYSGLDADVREYEPKVALESGPEGLDAITSLLRQAEQYLRPQGAIFLEISHDQGDMVVALARSLLPTATHISRRQDYHGHDRLVTILL